MTLTTILTEYWPILAVGFGVSALAFLVGRGMIRAKTAGAAKPLPDELDNLDIHSAKDRRHDGRRKGNPIEVDLFDPTGTLPPLLAYVTDRSRGGIASPMSACDSVISPPPPKPWTTRKAVSIKMLGASAQSTDPAKKIPSATNIISRRPKMSPRRP